MNTVWTNSLAQISRSLDLKIFQRKWKTLFHFPRRLRKRRVSNTKQGWKLFAFDCFSQMTSRRFRLPVLSNSCSKKLKNIFDCTAKLQKTEKETLYHTGFRDMQSDVTQCSVNKQSWSNLKKCRVQRFSEIPPESEKPYFIFQGVSENVEKPTWTG